jgi:hypothetical protein
VEPECALSDKTESFYFDDVAGLFFSYSNCGGSDSFSAEQCGTATTLETCGAMSQCAFDNGNCILGCDCVAMPADTPSTALIYGGEQYTTAYGAQCAAHDMPFGDCAGSSPADWCDDSWCYVAASCGLSDKVSSAYFPTLGDLFYSYSNCGAQDAFTDAFHGSGYGYGYGAI